MRAFVVLAMALAVWQVALDVHVVHAASFDCSLAESPLEHAICNNPDLSQEDETLAIAYSTALGGLSNDARTALQRSQKSWLGYAGRVCDPSALPPSGLAGNEADCLLSEFKDRQLLLEQSRMLGGLRLIFGDSNDAAFDDPPGQFGEWLATNGISYSQIDGGDDEAKTFNRLVPTYLRDAFGNKRPNGMDGYEHLWVSTVDDMRITLTDRNWAMNHGAAHGSSYLTFLHFLRDDRRLMKADDVFAKPGWQERLRALVVSALAVSYGDAILSDEETESAIREGSVNPTHWDFTPSGLLVQFSQEEIAAYVFGPPSVVIPWALVNHDMTRRGLDLCECW